eukprot:Rhum_TRINITY_DN3504_c0_g1::Rhum_TRINITY_DN3504_c0_g1_i1::g.11056::m.11056
MSKTVTLSLSESFSSSESFSPTLSLSAGVTPTGATPLASTATASLAVGEALVEDDPDWAAAVVASVFLGLLLSLLVFLCLRLYGRDAPNLSRRTREALAEEQRNNATFAQNIDLANAPSESDGLMQPLTGGSTAKPHTSFTNPAAPVPDAGLTDVVVDGSGSRTALVIVANPGGSGGGSHQQAVKLAHTLGAGSIRVLSAASAEKPTRAAILAGLRWLTATSQNKYEAEMLLIVSAPSWEDEIDSLGGFKPSDFSTAGPVCSSEIADELAQLPAASVGIVYDVPSQRAVWALPHCVAPRGCDAPPQPNRGGYDNRHILLLSPQGRCEPGLLVECCAAAVAHRETNCTDLLRNVYEELRTRNSVAFPLLWSNRAFGAATSFPVSSQEEASSTYQPPMLGQPPPVPQQQQQQQRPPSPLWYRTLSNQKQQAASGTAKPPVYPGSDSEDEAAWSSWMTNKPGTHSAAAGTASARPVPAHALQPASSQRRQPGSRRADSPSRLESLTWASPSSRSPVLAERLPSPASSPPLPVYAPQLASPHTPPFPHRRGEGGGGGTLLSHQQPRTSVSPQRQSLRSPGGSPRGLRSVSPAAAGLSSALYAPRGASVSAAPESARIMLQSHTSVPHFSYMRGTVRARLARGWCLELDLQDGAPLEVRLEDVERCGAEEAGGTDYPNQAMFVVPFDEPRLVLVFETTDTRDAWISWVHAVRPESVVILPTTFTIPGT